MDSKVAAAGLETQSRAVAEVVVGIYPLNIQSRGHGIGTDVTLALINVARGRAIHTLRWPCV